METVSFERFLKTKYDLWRESTIGGVCIQLTRDYERANVIILPSYIKHFYWLGDNGYLIKKAKQLYNETKSMKEWLYK